MTATPEIEQLIRLSAEQGNILPITSACGSACVFCSHHNNPEGVKVLRIGTRSLDQIRAVMPLLKSNREITIGESATRIIEGEPTLHPDFAQILTELRTLFPYTPVAVTTNGHHLTEELVRHIAKTGRVLVNLSLNSASPQGRRILMGDSEKNAKTAIESVMHMKDYGVAFQGSLVAMPNLTGYDDIKASVEYLANSGAQSVRVFAPAFSKHVREDIFPDADTIIEQLREYIPKLSEGLPCPVLLEPSMVSDLRCTLSGVIKGTPAWRDGMRRGDEITSIDGKAPRCRVEAFDMLESEGQHSISYIHSGTMRQAELHWGEPGASGVAMEYDFDPARAEYIKKAVTTAPGHVLALCSEFGYPVIRAVIEKFDIPESRISLFCVKNETFGGTIRASGLLCVSDYVRAFDEFLLKNEKPDAVILPAESFDYAGSDLMGESFTSLQERFALPTILV